MPNNNHNHNHDRDREVLAKAIADASRKPATQSAEDALMQKLSDITAAVQHTCLPVVKAGGWKEPDSMRQLLAKNYLHQLRVLSKDELAFACMMLLTERAMEYITNAPFGEGANESLNT